MSTKLIVLACLLAVSQARFINIKRPLISGRVIGGVDAQPGEFPHQVSIQIGLEENYTHYCGGSIINERWILTGALCMKPITGLSDFVVIKAGKHALNVTEPTEQESHIKTYFIHENYKGEAETIPFDIALIKLTTPLRFNKHVAPISLPAKGSEPSGTVIISGWGPDVRNQTHLEITNILQKASLEIIDRETCRKAVVALGGSENMIQETYICTGLQPGGMSPCPGGEGGPLISKDKDGKTELVGMAPFFAIGGDEEVPGIYWKVASFIDWIQDTISKN